MSNSIIGQAINNVHDNIRNIQFHNVPFLTDHLLALFIPTMRNLTTLGVYKCQLIHVGHTMRLLDIITHDRPKGKECQVNLDFYPNFHKGPISTGQEWEMGNFGATWDNWNRDSRLAIWQLVSQIIPRARSQGIDMESPWTAFRKWLEDGPCWRVEQTLQAIMSSTISAEKFAAHVDCGNMLHFGNVHKMFHVKRTIQSEGMKWCVYPFSHYSRSPGTCSNSHLPSFLVIPNNLGQSPFIVLNDIAQFQLRTFLSFSLCQTI